MGTTRFRAYQLGEAGGSFSYTHNGKLVLAEARFTDVSAENILDEITNYGGGRLDTLHITSWDVDHCNPLQLKAILEVLKPARVEEPGYPPHTESAKQCRRILRSYVDGNRVSWNPPTIDSLPIAERLERRDVILWPREIVEASNDNSTAKLFRTGDFTVLSLGDLESPRIAGLIAAQEIVCKETDVLVLPHHGADNGFLTAEFLRAVRPVVVTAHGIRCVGAQAV